MKAMQHLQITHNKRYDFFPHFWLDIYRILIIITMFHRDYFLQGYPIQTPSDNRYGGVPSVPAVGGFNAGDPYNYGKVPPQGN